MSIVKPTMGQASIIGLPHLFVSTTASLANEIGV
jgi:hypothetical protein